MHIFCTHQTNEVFRTCQHRQTQSRSFSAKRHDHYYSLLGVRRDADADSIKKGYFNQAKLSHPDLHPDDPAASVRFREVSEAYEVLSDESERAQYDLLGHDRYKLKQMPGAGAQQQQHEGGGYAAGGAYEELRQAEMFHRVWREYYMSEVSPYVSAVQAEASAALTAARRGEWGPAWEFAKARPGLIMGVVMPLAAVLRFPWLVSGAFGLAVRAVMSSMYLLSMLNHFLPRETKRDIADYLWRRMIAAARARKNAKAKTKDPGAGNSGSKSGRRRERRGRP